MLSMDDGWAGPATTEGPPFRTWGELHLLRRFRSPQHGHWREAQVQHILQALLSFGEVVFRPADQDITTKAVRPGCKACCQQSPGGTLQRFIGVAWVIGPEAVWSWLQVRKQPYLIIFQRQGFKAPGEFHPPVMLPADTLQHGKNSLNVGPRASEQVVIENVPSILDGQ